MQLTRSRACTVVLSLIAVFAAVPAVRAADTIPFETETLSNGLKVIYAPMPTSPVVHVRVLYHVGSKDEAPNRQGFAHMFEHMMFRGSEHVPPQQHMKLINNVGGYCNAFTSFDQTVYHESVPAGELNLPLWLEADRMVSFKVSPAIFFTERMVVTEEWRLKQNQPYGNVFEELTALAYTKHDYRWTPIGNMDHLRAATARDLQEFFNRYYLPNNAVLVIAGNIDVKAIKESVHRLYGWIPRGPDIVRVSPSEPEQTEARRREVKMDVPLARTMIAYHMPKWSDDDQDAIGILLGILGEGRSSRLSQALVTGKDPLCVRADASGMALEDGGLMWASAMIMNGKSAADVEKIIREQVDAIRSRPATAAELAKAKIQARLSLVDRWKTADNAAEALGEEMLFRGDLSHVNTAQRRIDAVTADDVLRVAKKYFADGRDSTLVVTPDRTAPMNLTPNPTSQPTSQPSTQFEPSRDVHFPDDYPAQAPLSGKVPTATFEKGVEKTIDDAKVIVMTDRRLPIVNWSLTFDGGSHLEPASKAGLGELVAAMIRRGPKGTTFNAFNETLESQGISLEIIDGGDFTRVSGSCLSDRLPEGIKQMHALIREPAFDPTQFEHLKAQSLANTQVALNSPTNVADRELKLAVFGDNPLGRYATPATIGAITLDDVKQHFAKVYGRPTEIALSDLPTSRGSSTDHQPILILAGDVSVEEGQKLAHELLADLPVRAKAEAATITVKPSQRRIILIDRPDARQSNIRIGVTAYDIRSDDKFPGSLAGQILSAGLDSRLSKYVRAEKGLTYGVYGLFSPSRQSGMFEVTTDTKVETTVEAINACMKVLDGMRSAPVTSKELADAKMRIAGSMVLSMQTISEQAQRRVDCILNGYPIDYYDVYPKRIAKVADTDVQNVMKKYVDEDKMVILVVGPAESLRGPLAELGKVEVMPMPASRSK